MQWDKVKLLTTISRRTYLNILNRTSDFYISEQGKKWKNNSINSKANTKKMEDCLLVTPLYFSIVFGVLSRINKTEKLTRTAVVKKLNLLPKLPLLNADLGA